MFATAYLLTLRRMLPVFAGATLSAVLALWWRDAAILATPLEWHRRQLATRQVRSVKPR